MKRLVLGAAAGASLGVALVVRAGLRVPLDDGLSLASSIPPLSHVLAAVIVGGFLGAVLGLRGRERLVTPFLPSGLAGAIFVPGAFAAAPFLAAFSGKFLDLVLFVGLTLALARIASSLPVRSAAPSPNLVALAGFVLYLAVGFWISREVGLSGDEPHYLLITHSLLQDGDIRVQDDYGAEEYRGFYRGKIGPRLATGTPYSVHGIGMPLLLLPGFAAFGLLGVLVTEAILASILLRAVYQTAWTLTESVRAALFATVGFGFASPALFLAASAYPELPAALVVTLASRRLLDDEAPGPAAATLWMLAVGALPFLHVKFIPLALLLATSLLYRFGRAFLPGLIVGGGISGLALLLFSFFTIGSFDPTASYGRQRIFLDRIPLGVGGLLFDQEFGLLVNAPVYLIGIAGLVALARRSRLLGTLSLLVFLSVLLPGAAHPLWSGGTSPPARFLFPVLPLLMVAASCLVARERELGVGRWSSRCLAFSLGLALFMLALPGGPFYLNARDGTGRVWEALSSSWNLTDYLPSLVKADPRSLVTAAALAFLLLGAIAAQIRRIRFPPLSPLVLLGFWLHDLTGISRSRDLEGRWALGAMHDLSSREGEAFLVVPGWERLSNEALAARMPLTLEAFPADGDPDHWWSRDYSIPAGRFRLSGVEPEGVSFYNGNLPLAEGGLGFSSAMGLEHFRVRARSLFETPKLVLLEPRPSKRTASLSIPIDAGLRLHALDEEVYPDPAGFWVREASRASFVLELAAPPRKLTLRIANGGHENRVRIDFRGSEEGIVLAPWEEREIPMAMKKGLECFEVESESGFRPSGLDPGSKDHRELGVLVQARPAFD